MSLRDVNKYIFQKIGIIIFILYMKWTNLWEQMIHLLLLMKL